MTPIDDLDQYHIAHVNVADMRVAHVCNNNWFSVRMPKRYDHAFAGSAFTDRRAWYAMDTKGNTTRHSSRNQAVAYLFAAYVNNN